MNERAGREEEGLQNAILGHNSAIAKTIFTAAVISCRGLAQG